LEQGVTALLFFSQRRKKRCRFARREMVKGIVASGAD